MMLVRLMVVACSLTMLGGCMCSDEVESSVRAPDGAEGRVVVRNCGATTRYSTIVELRDGLIWHKAFVLRDRPSVLLEWAQGTLLVRVPHDAQPVTSERSRRIGDHLVEVLRADERRP